MLQERVRPAAQQPSVKRRVSRSITDRQAAINRLLAEHNGEAKPFTSTADRDKTIAVVRRGHNGWTQFTRSPLSTLRLPQNLDRDGGE